MVLPVLPAPPALPMLRDDSPSVLICSAQFWKSPVQISAHQFARQFVRHGWRVGFIGNPVSPLHLWRRRDPVMAARFAECRQGGLDFDGRLFHWTPFTALPLVAATARWRWPIEAWPSLVWPSFRHTLRRHGFDPLDLLILDSALHGHLLDTVQARRTVLRITDCNTGFASASRALAEAERRIAQRVDVVVVTAERLIPYARDLGARTIVHVGNGVDLRHFASPAPAPPPEYAAIPEPRAVFVGAIAEWFGFDLLAAVATQLPDVSFVLIGPGASARHRLPALPNLHVLGPRPYADVPAYLQHAQAGLIPFDVAGRPDLVAAINPIKLYEYLACGLPVVATSWPELRSLGSPAVLCDGVAEFAAGLRHVLAAGDKERRTRIDYAQSCDWSSRFTSLMAAILPPSESDARPL